MEAKDDGKRRIHELPLEDGAAHEDSDLAPSIAEGEGLDQAQDAEALEQDPEKVANSLGNPQPPTLERVGPTADQGGTAEDE